MKPLVGIIMGSDSDAPIMQEAAKCCSSSAFHMRSAFTARTARLIARMNTSRSARSRGLKMIIAGAGSSAHLAGVTAAETILPVIGVPIDSSPLSGFDALMATVQMPPGVPVSTMGVGKSGATNAAILAVEILALSDAGLAEKLVDYKAKLEVTVAEKSKKVASEIGPKA